MKIPPSFLVAKTMVAILLISSGTLFYSAFAVSTKAVTLSLAVSGSRACNILDGDGAAITSPTITITGVTYSNTANQTTTGSLATSSQKIGFFNPTSTGTWTLTIGATSGENATWVSGSDLMDFNDAADGSDGVDTDAVGGQLSITLGTGGTAFTLAGTGASTTTGITPLGIATAFSGATEITLASASGSEQAPGGWTIVGGLLSQIVPARIPTGTYTLGLTITYT